MEEVRSVLVEIEPVFNNTPVEGVSGFSTSGRVRAVEARQLLRAAQVGGLPDARLELNVYELLLRLGRPPGPWIGEEIQARNQARGIAATFALLRQRHHIADGAEDDFNIRRPDEVIKAQMEQSDTLANLLFWVALISLLVGGIGIMNVMLAAVTQRTREIGIRLAVGATAFAVELQFLGEAVILGLAGGLLGIIVSAVSVPGVGRALEWPISISVGAVTVAVISSIGVGLCSGLYPAWRASRLDPIEALRHE